MGCVAQVKKKCFRLYFVKFSVCFKLYYSSVSIITRGLDVFSGANRNKLSDYVVPRGLLMAGSKGSTRLDASLSEDGNRAGSRNVII
jgi:hypothetical protein